MADKLILKTSKTPVVPKVILSYVGDKIEIVTEAAPWKVVVSMLIDALPAARVNEVQEEEKLIQQVSAMPGLKGEPS